MPGIVGVISSVPVAECQRWVASMVQTMEHEEFYRSGTYAAAELGLYAGWIAHPASFAADQVFLNETKDIALLISGECFTDRAGRSMPTDDCHKPDQARGDWLVHLYEKEGEGFFPKLSGLFSGLLIDKRRRQVFLFNDRYGLDRIYWAETKDAFYFASEAKALLRVLQETRAFDMEGVAQYLTFGCTVEWRTLFRGVSLLPGGSLWAFRDGQCRRGRYFEPETLEAQVPLRSEDFTSIFQQTFNQVLPRYFESHCKVGISLTGGLDTRMIMACLPEVSREKVSCYTFGGVTGETADARIASQVAKACGLDHHLLRLGQDFFSNFDSIADRTVYATDGCFGVVGAHEIYLNKLACALAPVRMTGVFGSEILRGVSTLKQTPMSPDLLAPALLRQKEALLRQFSIVRRHPVSFAAFREIPWSIFGSLAACRSQVMFRTPYLDNALLALAYQCPDHLRASTVPAFRCIREHHPGLALIPTDMGVVGQAGGVSTWAKRAYAKATFKLDYFQNEGLPHWLSPIEPWLGRAGLRTGVLGHHKYLYYRSWFQKQLAGYLHDAFMSDRIRQAAFWNQDFIKHVLNAHTSGRRNYVLEINAILTLEAVERLLVQRWN